MGGALRVNHCGCTTKSAPIVVKKHTVWGPRWLTFLITYYLLRTEQRNSLDLELACTKFNGLMSCERLLLLL